MKNRFVVFSCGFNAEKYVKNNMESVGGQQYGNYVHVIVDDFSQDHTIEEINKYKTPKTFVYRNTENLKWIRNAKLYLDKHIESDEDIIVLLDLDDWLSHPHVLQKLDKVYNNTDCWTTYGSFYYVGAQRTSHWIPKYKGLQLQEKDFRFRMWSYTHPRTFKAFLWKNIKDEDLRGPDGEYPKYSYDRFIGMPILEMASPDHVQYIDEVLCQYNDLNPIQVEKKFRKEQEMLALYVNTRPKYESYKKS